jgi:adenylosuccinate lyase
VGRGCHVRTSAGRGKGAAIRGSVIYGSLWGTDELRAVFDDRGRLQSWLDILAALAGAQAELGLIPERAGDEIVDKARVDLLDLEFVASETRRTAHSTLGIIRAMQRVLSAEAGEWFCNGATVQDVSDTWAALVMRKMGQVARRDLLAIEDALLALAARHRDTAIAARTHGQPGVAISFGFKLAVLASEIRRHLERLDQGRSRWLVGQLGGAAGTGSFWGARVTDLQQRFCERLGLGVPDIAWLSARDRLAEFSCLLAMVVHTLAKIGNEIVQLQRPELGELSEPFQPGQVGSITMPHKRNPERSEHLVTLARLVRGDAGVMVESMIVEHERDGRAWKAEWAAFPDLCLLSGAALATARQIIDGLEVHVDAMARNLADEQGYLRSEQVMEALVGRVGKQSAHQLVYRVAMAGQERGVDFGEALRGDAEVMEHLQGPALQGLLTGGLDLDTAAGFVDRVVERARQARQAEVAW